MSKKDEEQESKRATGGVVRVLGLYMQNVMRVSAAEVKPGSNPVITISGGNKQGKTTLMRGAAMILEGKKSRPRRTLREGTTKGGIQLDLGDTETEIRAELKLRKGKPDQIVVTRADGAPSGPPQELFDKLRSKRTLDVRRFSEIKGAERIKTVEGLTGLDFTDHEVKRAEVYEQRKDANSEVKRLTGAVESMPHHKDAPEAVVSVAKLTGELKTGMEKNAANEEQRRKLADARREGKVQVDTVAKVEEECTDAERALARAEEAFQSARNRLSKAKADLDTMRVDCTAFAAEVGGLDDVILDELHAKTSTAEETNAKVRDNAARAKLNAELAKAEAKAEERTNYLAQMDQVKADAIAKADYPVKGLTIGDDDVMFNGFDFSEASGAEKLVVGAAIDLALHPDFRAVYIDEGSNLDLDSRSALEKWAEANDAQVWLALASEEPGSVIIEDGQVKDAAPAEG